MRLRSFNLITLTTDNYSVITNPDVDAVIITTRHNSHAPLVIEALEAGKHVFVEKPLCITADELKTIKQAMSGYRRRRFLWSALTGVLLLKSVK